MMRRGSPNIFPHLVTKIMMRNRPRVFFPHIYSDVYASRNSNPIVNAMNNWFNRIPHTGNRTSNPYLEE